eukprot:COSAG02_NODE_7343_length_3054_cov_1034.035533_2_plen_117_part_00
MSCSTHGHSRVEGHAERGLQEAVGAKCRVARVRYQAHRALALRGRAAGRERRARRDRLAHLPAHRLHKVEGVEDLLRVAAHVPGGAAREQRAAAGDRRCDSGSGRGRGGELKQQQH